MWWDLGESVGSRTRDIFSFLFEVLIRRGTFFLKKTSWIRPVVPQFKQLKDYQDNRNKRNAFLFLDIYISQSMLPTSDWSHKIATHVNLMRTTHQLVKVNILSYIKPIREGVRKSFVKVCDPPFSKPYHTLAFEMKTLQYQQLEIMFESPIYTCSAHRVCGRFFFSFFFFFCWGNRIHSSCWYSKKKSFCWDSNYCDLWVKSSTTKLFDLMKCGRKINIHQISLVFAYKWSIVSMYIS